MKKIASLLFISLSLAGCATQQKSVTNFEGKKEFQYSFQKDEFSKEPITQRDIVTAVEQALNAGTRYPFRQRWNGSFYEFSGMYQARNNQEGIFVSYSKGENFGKSENQFMLSEHQNVTKFNINIASKTDDGVTTAVAVINNDVIISNGTSPLGRRYDAIGSTSQFSSELNKILGNGAAIHIKRYTTVEGEINVPFNTESIYANFSRKLGKYNYRQNEVKTTDIAKFNSYSYKVGNEILPLNVNVLPYRNGSKVVYALSIPYRLTGDGMISLTSAEISDIRKTVEKIAND